MKVLHYYEGAELTKTEKKRNSDFKKKGSSDFKKKDKKKKHRGQ